MGNMNWEDFFAGAASSYAYVAVFSVGQDSAAFTGAMLAALAVGVMVVKAARKGTGGKS